MTLVEPEAFVALIDRGHDRHAACVRCWQETRGPLGTVWPAVCAAVASLEGSAPAQAAVLQLIARGAVRLLALDDGDVEGMVESMVGRRRSSLSHAATRAAARRHGIDRLLTPSGLRSVAPRTKAQPARPRRHTRVTGGRRSRWSGSRTARR